MKKTTKSKQRGKGRPKGDRFKEVVAIRLYPDWKKALLKDFASVQVAIDQMVQDHISQKS